ncbi:MAG: MEDS domain-containing protein [Candidatus Omnitrophica bacterium]|nr:MEDS domain-containing protein [Candidatus Omnitrophota bacterium]
MFNAQEVDYGTHFCNIYRNKYEQISVLIPYLVSGLRNHEKCVYVYDEFSPDEICRLIVESGIDAQKYLETKQLVLLPAKETYLTKGFFSSERMLEAIQELYYETLKSGFKGLRGAGEMQWYLSDPPGAFGLLDYENRINVVVPKLRCFVLCQYDEARFKEDILAGVIRTHPEVIMHGNRHKNPFYIKPDLFSAKSREEYFKGTYTWLRDNIISN